MTIFNKSLDKMSKMMYTLINEVLYISILIFCHAGFFT